MTSPAITNRYATILVAALAVVFAAWTLEPEWHAGWQLMDDWMVVAEAGADQRLSKAEFLAAMDTSEATHPGADARYRPALMTLHLVEASVLGTSDPGEWFRWRTVQWAFVLSTFAWIIVSWSGAVAGVAITAYLATQYYWRDIWAHLFLSEPWCAVGSAIFALGWHRSRNARRSDAPVAAAALGLAIAAGSKENFLLLAPMLAWMAWKARREGHLGAGGMVACAAGLLYSAGIIAAVLWGSAHVGHDTYGNPTDLGTRLALLKQPFPLMVAACTVLGITVLLGFRHYFRGQDVGKSATVDEIARGLLVAVAASSVLLLSQYAFYAGKWPSFGGRFDFPGCLAEVIMLTAAAWAWRRAESAALLRPPVAKICRWTIALLVAGLALRHAGSLRAAAQDTATHSRAVTEVIESVAVAVEGNSLAPVLLIATKDQEEPTVAIAVFLSFRLPGHPLFVRTVKSPGDEEPGDERVAALRRLEAGWRQRPGGATQPSLRPLTGLDEARKRAGGACVALMVRDYGVPRLASGCDPS